MEKSTIQDYENEYQTLESAVRQNADELLKWLAGTTRFFVKSMKTLSEESKNKELFRGYVTHRLFNHIQQLAEIADIHAIREETDGKEEGTSERVLHEPEVDIENLAGFYNRYIVAILAENKDTLDILRNTISVMKGIEGSGDSFGKDVKDFIHGYLCEIQDKTLEQQAAALLCLVMVAYEFKYEDMGKHGSYIEDLIDNLSAIVCGVVTRDYNPNMKYK